MVQARLDALKPGTLRLLQTGSVFGEVFWLEAARALLAPEERAAAGALAGELVEMELLEESESSRSPLSASSCFGTRSFARPPMPRFRSS
jgi:hypothetical protein